jgi:hypothetical protein
VFRAKDEAVRMESDLDNGRVPRYSSENWRPLESRFIFTQSLFHGYLALLKKKSGDGNVLLERNAKGKPIFRPKRDAQILFDRRGGTFVPEEAMMRWYFRTRCAFISSLWDMSTKEKFFIPELRKILEVPP